MPSGKIVATKVQWENEQRPYLYSLFEKNVYGAIPEEKTEIGFKIREQSNDALNGTATRKQVRIYIHPTDSSVYIDLLIYLPNKTQGAIPVFLGYNFLGNQSVINDTSVFLTEKWIYVTGGP
jgi:hypothetical protein